MSVLTLSRLKQNIQMGDKLMEKPVFLIFLKNDYCVGGHLFIFTIMMGVHVSH